MTSLTGPKWQPTCLILLKNVGVASGETGRDEGAMTTANIGSLADGTRRLEVLPIFGELGIQAPRGVVPFFLGCCSEWADLQSLVTALF